jgi:ribosomal protein S8
MSSIYNIADIAVRINVGYRGLDKVVRLEYTKLAVNLSTLLYKQGLITAFTITRESIFLTLKYANSKPLINVIKVISRPGKRVY